MSSKEEIHMTNKHRHTQSSITLSKKSKIKILDTIFPPSNWQTFTKMRIIHHWLGWGEMGLLICLVGMQTSRTFLEIMWNQHRAF